ncbi:MAG: universal stress protein [Planctomycetota bacterium]
MTTDERRILVPLDLGSGSLETLREAMDLARACGGRLHLLHAVPEAGEGQLAGDRAAREALERFSDVLVANGPELIAGRFLIRAGRPERVILAAARELDAAAIVLRGGASWWRRARGRDVLAALSAASPCPVCVVPWASSSGPPRDARERRALQDGLALQQVALALLAGALVLRGWSALSGATGGAALWVVSALAGVALAALTAARRLLRPLRREPGEVRQACLDARAGAARSAGCILVPLGPEDDPGQVMPLVELLARGFVGDALFLHLAEPSASWARGAAGTAARAFAQLRALVLSEAGSRLGAGLLIRTGHPAAELLQATHELDPAYVVVPSGADLPPRALERLLRVAPCPVWLVPRDLDAG